MTIDFLINNIIIDILKMSILPMVIIYSILACLKCRAVYYRRFGVSIVFIATLLSIFNSSNSPKYKIEETTQYRSQDYGEIKDLSPETLTDQERIEYNKKIIDSNKLNNNY